VRRCRFVYCALLGTTLSACGTILGRTHPDHIGAYPGEAITFDFALMASPFRGDAPDAGSGETDGATNFVLGFVSLPFDLVFDVVLLPADLIGWLFGLRREWDMC
jgi:uncharacterized protein YceK